MAKAEIIDQVAQRLGITKSNASVTVNTVFKTFTEAMARGDKVELRGFGSFTIRHRKARLGRNSELAEIVHVPAKKVPLIDFKASNDLKIVGDEQETISEADLTELLDFIKECVAKLQPKLAEANQKLDRLIKERAEFWQRIEEKNKEIAKYAHNR